MSNHSGLTLDVELLFPPAVSLGPVLDLRFLHRLPLHIRGGIDAAAFEWNDVVHDVSLSAFRIAGVFHELFPGGSTSFDPAVTISGGNCGLSGHFRVNGFAGTRRLRRGFSRRRT